MTAHSDDGKKAQRGVISLLKRGEEVILCDEPLNASIHKVFGLDGTELGWIAVHTGKYGMVWAHIPEKMAKALVDSGSIQGVDLDVRMLAQHTSRH